MQRIGRSALVPLVLVLVAGAAASTPSASGAWRVPFWWPRWPLSPWPGYSPRMSAARTP